MTWLSFPLREKTVDFLCQPLQHLGGKQQFVRAFHSPDSDDNAIVLMAVPVIIALWSISLSGFFAFYINFVQFGILGELDATVKKIVKPGNPGLQLLYIIVISVHCCRC